MSVKDMTGQRHGSLLVISRAPSDAYGNAMWLCRCDCGKVFVTQGCAIRNGHTKSCGHLQRETASARSATHRMSKTRLYKAWSGMKQRCENPKNSAYRDYGANGITVCEEWHSFESFYAWAMAQGYEQGLTVERNDNSKGYGPDNCRLATRKEQNRNTRRTHRIRNGKRVITAAEAGRIAGVDRSTVAHWVRDGLVETVEDVLAFKARRKANA